MRLLLGIPLALVLAAAAAFMVALARRERLPGRRLGMFLPALAAFFGLWALHTALLAFSVAEAWHGLLLLAEAAAVGIAAVGLLLETWHARKR